MHLFSQERARLTEEFEAASRILVEQAEERMSGIQKEIRRMEWRRKRWDLQKKRIKAMNSGYGRNGDGNTRSAVPAGEPSGDIQDQSEMVSIHMSNKEGEAVEATDSAAGIDATGGRASDAKNEAKSQDAIKPRDHIGLETKGDASGTAPEGSENDNERADSSFLGDEKSRAEVAPSGGGSCTSTPKKTLIIAEAASPGAAFQSPTGDETVLQRINTERVIAEWKDDIAGESSSSKHSLRNRSSADSAPEASTSLFDAPLPEAVQVCVHQLVDLHYRGISKLCVRYFVEELQLLDHFSILKKFYLMEAGDFAHSFLTQIVDRMSTSNSRVDGWSNLHQRDASEAFDSAMQSMCPVPALADRFELQLRVPAPSSSPLLSSGDEVNSSTASSSVNINQGSIRALDCIHLDYKADFPFNLLLREEVLHQYQEIFSFLLCLRRGGFLLKAIWQDHIKSTRLHPCYDLLQGIHHEMSHFLTMLDSFICHKIHSSSDLGASLGGANLDACDIQGVDRLHLDYVARARQCCFLSPEHQPVLNIILTALQTIADVWTVCKVNFHLTSHWTDADGQFEVVTSQLERARERFRNGCRSLRDIFKHKQMEEAVVQFDFNSFYKNNK